MTIRRIFNWVVGVPIALAAIAFAVANRQWISVSLDPFAKDLPRLALNMPLWGLFFCGILLGIFVGWFAAWRGNGKWRRSTREARIELYKVQQAHDHLKREAEARAVALRGDTTL
ncbi:DUF1049 domain-containing protein [Aestuariivirga sp.]|uniref:DUF1049 domain-containing protein n=1 Tax=Aestuariivirga sp. TaxID=2650926 RepID=UPI0039E36CC5